jgi:hypothetical protein
VSWNGHRVWFEDHNVVGTGVASLTPEQLEAFLRWWRTTDAGRNLKACPVCGTDLEGRRVVREGRW